MRRSGSLSPTKGTKAAPIVTPITSLYDLYHLYAERDDSGGLIGIRHSGLFKLLQDLELLEGIPPKKQDEYVREVMLRSAPDMDGNMSLHEFFLWLNFEVLAFLPFSETGNLRMAAAPLYNRFVYASTAVTRQVNGSHRGAELWEIVSRDPSCSRQGSPGMTARQLHGLCSLMGVRTDKALTDRAVQQVIDASSKAKAVLQRVHSKQTGGYSLQYADFLRAVLSVSQQSGLDLSTALARLVGDAGGAPCVPGQLLQQQQQQQQQQQDKAMPPDREAWEHALAVVQAHLLNIDFAGPLDGPVRQPCPEPECAPRSRTPSPRWQAQQQEDGEAECDEAAAAPPRCHGVWSVDGSLPLAPSVLHATELVRRQRRLSHLSWVRAVNSRNLRAVFYAYCGRYNKGLERPEATDASRQDELQSLLDACVCACNWKPYGVMEYQAWWRLIHDCNAIALEVSDGRRLTPNKLRNAYVNCSSANGNLLGSSHTGGTDLGRLLSDAHKYVVVVKTGDVANAGTDAKVSIVLKGTAGRSGELTLSSTANDFERGSLRAYTVSIGTAFIGRVVEVDVGFASRQGVGGTLGGLLAKQWWLQYVEVHDLTRGESQRFTYDSGFLGGQATRVVLQPGWATQKYRVTVKTCAKAGAGTDADVSIIIKGTRGGGGGAAPERKLDSGGAANDFEAGSLASYVIDLGSIDLGDVTAVDLGFATQQSAGGKLSVLTGKAWLPDWVRVEDLRTGRLVCFLHDGAWINDRRPRAELTPSASRSDRFRVTVQTGDRLTAGTDADVSITLRGSLKETAELRLDSRGNDFERGSRRSYEVESGAAGDIGLLQEIDVGFASRQTAAGAVLGSITGKQWLCSWVQVENLATGESTMFVYDDWLRGDVQQRVTLSPAHILPAPRYRYRLMVQTGSRAGSGTDADISVVLRGEDFAESPELPLDSPSAATNDFEAGSLRSYDVDIRPAGGLGQLRELDIGFATTQSLAGSLAGLTGKAWSLSYVVVEDLTTGERTCFPWDESAPVDSRNPRVVLKPAPLQEAKAAGKRLEDILPNSMVRQLQLSPHRQHEPDTLTGTLTFPQFLETLRQISEASLGHPYTDHEVNLKLLQICSEMCALHPPLPAVHTLLKAHLGSSRVALRPRGAFKPPTPSGHGGQGSPQPGGRSPPAAGKPLVSSLPDVTYTLVVATTRGALAGTDSVVSVELLGDGGCTTGVRYLPSDAKLFESGSVDKVEVTAPDVGSVLTALVVRKDGAGFAADWHLDYIKVLHPGSGTWTLFRHGGWVKGRAEVKLLPEAAAAAAAAAVAPADEPAPSREVARASYKVLIKTGNRALAGTDSRISLELLGRGGGGVGAKPSKTTGPLPLPTSAALFEKNRCDEVALDNVPDVGLPTGLVVRSDGSGFAPDWALDWVKVQRGVGGEWVVFPHNGWIKSGAAEVRLTPGIAAEDEVDSASSHSAEAQLPAAAAPAVASRKGAAATASSPALGADRDGDNDDEDELIDELFDVDDEYVD